MKTMRLLSIWLRILALLGIVILACGVKNYIAYLVSGTILCPYLCPSVMGVELSFEYPVLAEFFTLQSRAQGSLQGLVNLLTHDPHRLATVLVFAPLLEEFIYRGPMYLSRKTGYKALWWAVGVAIAFVFALSHHRSGMALFPLFVLGVGSLWLIASTGRFWPSVTLHFLHNFFFASVSVYQSLWIGD